jgi:DNA-binding MarR family transcriptional regulator
MSSSLLGKFNNALGSIKEERDSGRPSEPTELILKVLLANQGLLPVSDLRSHTNLRDEIILDAIERLRGLKQVEIVEMPDTGDRKFIRLTPGGYAVFAA